MAIDIVRGNITNPMATSELISEIRKIDVSLEGTLYTGYPLSATTEQRVTVDALLVTKEYGIIAFIFSNLDKSQDVFDQQGELFYQLTNTLTKYPSLRKGKRLAFEPKVISILPVLPSDFEVSEDYLVVTQKEVTQTIENIDKFNDNYYSVLVESLQKIANIKPRKKRENVKIEGSKGNIIKQIEKEIANLDQWQKKASLEICEGPQSIRGLAGSGKTIVLALKAAYLHTQNPDWNIVVTYYTRSLWQQYRDLINKFVNEFSGDDPDWEKIHLFHAWGSPSEKGVYSEVAKTINFVPVNFSNARIKYGNNGAFKGICDEILSFLPENIPPAYDAFLIDEAQDMPASFFKLAYKLTNEPKRIIWAYDELQNLSSVNMPTIEEMFGFDSDGKALVQLRNNEGEPMQDIVLPVCYRNPQWALSLAHSLGFGIYRKSVIQHFDELNLWEEIGYKIEKGKLDYGKKVTLSRRSDATPEYFSRLLVPDDVIISKRFDDEDQQYAWVAKEIKYNIKNEELDPDDILVVFPDVITAKSKYYQLSKHLEQNGIRSILTGVTNDRDLFHISGCVTCSSIFRAKGNEAPMVYILNSDYCYTGSELIKLRNTLFTAITRSRAWVRIYGTGDSMEGLLKEINDLISNGYKLNFKIPTKAELEKMRTIHRERTASENKKIEEASKGLKTFIELAQKGDFDADVLPEFETLMQLYMKKKMSETNEDDE